MPEVHSLVRRVAAAQSVLDAWRGRELQWGRSDCSRLAAAAIRAMGHKVRLGQWGLYSSEIGALRALKRTGFVDLGEGLDSLGLPRIPPAATLPCDLIGIAAESFGGVALMVALGGGRVLGWTAGHPVCAVMQPAVDPAPLAAWRL